MGFNQKTIAPIVYVVSFGAILISFDAFFSFCILMITKFKSTIIWILF